MSKVNMPSCIDCQDEHYILQDCCDGRECGCLAMPVSMSVCKECNSDGKKPMGEYVETWADSVEFI